MSTDLPPAGWYPNPDATGGLRWWSGVGWTEYTRGGASQEATQVLGPAQTQEVSPAQGVVPVPEEVPVQEAAPTQQLSAPAEVPAGDPVLDQPVAAPVNPWAQPTAEPEVVNPWAASPAATWGQPAAGGYAAYQPVPQQPLTGSGMRPLGGMFSDIGRIVRRGWLPIIGISVAIWAAVTAIYAIALLTTVDLTALQRGFDLIGASAESNPETGLPASDGEISAAFRDAFSALSPSGWALLITVLTVLLLVASAIQTAAVNRISMDAAAGQRVSWSAGWKSGFTAGFRLFGYYVLLSLLAVFAWTILAVVAVALWALAPALSIVVGILGFLALLALTVWLSGRLIPVIAQVVLGRGAISWSWRHTKGKFWAVLGRYLLWSIAASVIVNIIVTVVSIPVSLVFLGTASSTASTTQLGASLVLTLITLPVSMALSVVTFLGVVPIWRDLTDDARYRSIGEDGLPVAVEATSGS